MKKYNQVTIRLESDFYEHLQDICQYEGKTHADPIPLPSLIEAALKYVFMDNERMRQCFARNRYFLNK